MRVESKTDDLEAISAIMMVGQIPRTEEIGDLVECCSWNKGLAERIRDESLPSSRTIELYQGLLEREIVWERTAAVYGSVVLLIGNNAEDKGVGRYIGKMDRIIIVGEGEYDYEGLDIAKSECSFREAEEYELCEQLRVDATQWLDRWLQCENKDRER